MLHLCLHLYNYLFLNKLPRELQVLPTKADMQEKKVLVARADSFAAHHQKLAHDTGAPVAAMSLDDLDDNPVVAVVRLNGSKGSPTVVEAPSQETASGRMHSPRPSLTPSRSELVLASARNIGSSVLRPWTASPCN